MNTEHLEILEQYTNPIYQEETNDIKTYQVKALKQTKNTLITPIILLAFSVLLLFITIIVGLICFYGSLVYFLKKYKNYKLIKIGINEHVQSAIDEIDQYINKENENFISRGYLFDHDHIINNNNIDKLLDKIKEQIQTIKKRHYIN